MKRPAKILLLLLFAAILAGAAGSAWFFFRRAGAPDDALPYRLGGKLRFPAPDRVEISGLELAGRPTGDILTGILTEFASARQIEVRGDLALPGFERGSYFCRAQETGRPLSWKLEFLFDIPGGASLGGGGEIDLGRQRLELQLRGRELPLGSLGDLLGLPLPEYLTARGVIAECSAALRFAGEGYRLAGIPSISGRLAATAALSLHHLKLARPIGAFQLGADREGRARIRFPESSFTLGALTVGAPAATVTPDALRLRGAATLAAPYLLSAPLDFEGEIAPDSFNWKFTATAPDRLMAGSDRFTLMLDTLQISGAGSRKSGKITTAGRGASITCRTGAAALWSGGNPTISGETAVAIDPAGNLRPGRRLLGVDFDRLVLSDPAVSVNGTKGFFRFERDGADAERPTRFRFGIEALEASSSPYTLTASKLELSGEAEAQGGFPKLSKLEFAAAAAVWTAPAVKYTAAKPAGRAELASAPDGQLELRLQAALATLAADRPRFAFDTGAADWQFSARIRPENRQWSRLSHQLAACELELALPTGRLAAARAEIKAVQPEPAREPERRTMKFHDWTVVLPTGWQLTGAELDARLDRATGRISFADAALTGWDDIQLSGISLELPLQFDPAGEPAAGTLAVARIAGGLSLADSLRAELRHRGGEFSYRGRTGSSFFAGNGFFFTGKLERQDEDYRLATEFSLPAARLKSEIDLARLLPGFPGKLPFSGRLGAEGALLLAAAGAELELGILLDGDTDYGESLPVRFRRLAGTLNLPNRGRSRSRLRFGALEAGASRTGDGEFELVCRDGKVSVASLQTTAWGGLARLRRPVEFSQTADAAPHFDLEVEAIDSDAFLPTPEWRQAVSRPLSGRLTVQIESGRAPELSSAELAAGQSGKLRLGAMEKFRQPGQASPVLLAFAAAAWRDFDFDTLKLTIRQLPRHWQLRLDVDGRPALPLPFVFADGDFRVAAPGEHGFDGQVEIGGDYAIPRDRQADPAPPAP